MNLTGKLKILFPDINFLTDCLLQDDSNGLGQYIKTWNRLEPQPTQAELDAAGIGQADPVLKEKCLTDINHAVNAYIVSHYDMGTQASFQAVYVMDGTPQEVKTALLGAWAWVQSILGYYYTKKAEIVAADDPESVTWDFLQFDATDPQVSLQDFVG